MQWSCSSLKQGQWAPHGWAGACGSMWRSLCLPAGVKRGNVRVRCWCWHTKHPCQYLHLGGCTTPDSSVGKCQPGCQWVQPGLLLVVQTERGAWKSPGGVAAAGTEGLGSWGRLDGSHIGTDRSELDRVPAEGDARLGVKWHSAEWSDSKIDKGVLAHCNFPAEGVPVMAFGKR